MLSGITIYIKDKIWAKILGELGATMLKTADLSALTFALPAERLSALDLKSEILKQIDQSNMDILYKIFRTNNPDLPKTQEKIVLLLYKHDGLSIKQINEFLGYSENTKTHTFETAIYQLRKNFGANFIKQSCGVYKLGQIKG